MALSTEVSLDRLTLLELAVPHRVPFRSGIGERSERRALLVRWTDADGAWGIGECSCRPDPFFSGEFVDGAVAVLQDHVFPILPQRGTLSEVVSAVGRVRGWKFTIAALLDALFDTLRRKGLQDPLSAAGLPRAAHVPVGISLGLFAGVDDALEHTAAAVSAGYSRLKLKVSPQLDPAIPRAVRERFPELQLGFDANGTCREDDLELLAALAEVRPCCLEQPFDPQRLDLAAALKARFPELRVCLDESIDGLGTLISAHRLGALDEVNIKPGRVGGQLAVLDILDYCGRHGISAWVGGMFETGIGRYANLRVAARLPEATAHDLNPPSRYLTSDVVVQPLEMSADGYLDAGDDEPVEVDEAALQDLVVRQLELAR